MELMTKGCEPPAEDYVLRCGLRTGVTAEDTNSQQVPVNRYQDVINQR